MRLTFALIVALAFGQRGGAPQGPQFDQAAVDRGKATFIANCGFCHGTNARGGDGGADLIRSVLVLDDEEGKEIGEFLKLGRPDKGMQSFPNLTPQQVSDIATFLHREIYMAANRRTYEILDILVGDAKAGETYFNGAGKCNTCHSSTGDMKGIGAKYDPVTLQGRIVMPPRGTAGGRGGGGGPEIPGPLTTVTVSFPTGQSYSGALVRVTDFDVTLRDSSGAFRSFTRNGEVPKVETKDPLLAHVDMLSKYKDADIHNLTAYLVTLK
jgi:mono/diheme cytochrome c family protein